MTAPETNDLIIRRLKELGRHLRTEQHVHSYPHCWRCRSKLIYYARDSWFVRTTAIRERMLEFNAGIAWHPPETGTGRFGEWLAGNVDWALSRERYWGTPLPIWVNDRDPTHIEVIGSLEELQQKTGYAPASDLEVHKPWIDEPTWIGARRRHDAPRAGGDRHLVRFRGDALRRSGTIRSSIGPSSPAISRRTTSAKGSTRPAAGSIRCSPSRRRCWTRRRTGT